MFLPFIMHSIGQIFFLLRKIWYMVCCIFGWFFVSLNFDLVWVFMCFFSRMIRGQCIIHTKKGYVRIPNYTLWMILGTWLCCFIQPGTGRDHTSLLYLYYNFQYTLISVSFLHLPSKFMNDQIRLFEGQVCKIYNPNQTELSLARWWSF